MRQILLVGLGRLADAMPGGPTVQKNWDKVLDAWERFLTGCEPASVETALDRWGQSGERFPTPSQIRRMAQDVESSAGSFRFAWDGMTGWHRGDVKRLTAAERYNIAKRVPTPKSAVYWDDILALVKLLDEAVWLDALTDWGERLARADLAEVAAFRAKVLGAEEINPFEVP